ncbi:MAG TPA: GNAT family N-acetyltransferase [Polyangia bacterium]|nr:GNAT family N-acetyltransferase [Polyangia bacterium]
MAPQETITVRPARPMDLVSLLPMMAAFNRGEGIRFRRARVTTALRRLLREPRLGIVLVAEGPRRRSLDGYAVATFGYDLEFDGTDAFLTELYVRPARRRLGVGARLLEAVAHALREAGARAITLLVWPENRPARRAYARAGFEEVRRIAMVRRLAG